MEKYFTKEYLLKVFIALVIIIVPFFVLNILDNKQLVSKELYYNFKSIIISVYTGVGASYMFLRLYLFNKKPKIKISEHISLSSIENVENYIFKFINESDVDLYDVRVEAKLLTPFNEASGKNLRGKEILFVDNNIYFLPCKNKKDDYNLHAIRIRTIHDLKSEWNSCDGSSFVRLTIIAKHSLSGFNKVFVKDYLHPDTITSKKHKNGDNLGVGN